MLLSFLIFLNLYLHIYLQHQASGKLKLLQRSHAMREDSSPPPEDHALSSAAAAAAAAAAAQPPQGNTLTVNAGEVLHIGKRNLNESKEERGRGETQKKTKNVRKEKRE